MTKLTLEENKERPGSTPFAQTYFHGTKADLKVVDLIEADHTGFDRAKENARPGPYARKSPCGNALENVFCPCGHCMKEK